MVALAEAESLAHEMESALRRLRESSAVFSAPRIGRWSTPRGKLEEIEASSRRVIPAGYSSGIIHGLVASAHVFQTVVLGRRLASLQGRHTMEDTS